MYWNSIYGGGGCTLGGVTALFLTRSPRSDTVLAVGAIALAVGVPSVNSGVLGLLWLRSEPKSQ